MASAVNVRESSAIHLGVLPYFVVSLGINKNNMLQGLWVTCHFSVTRSSMFLLLTSCHDT